MASNRPQDWPTHLIDRRTLLRGAAAVLGGGGALALAGCGSSSSAGTSRKVAAKPDGDLLLFNWAQYMNPSVIKGFEKEYGVQVHKTYFDNMDAMMAKLHAGVRFDIIFPENSYADKLVQAGQLMQIDHAQLKNWGDVVSYFSNPWYDPGARHTIPYAVWTTGIGWRTDKVSDLKGSWNDLWEHPEAKGHIWLLDDMREVIGMSLMRLGYDVNSTDQSQLSKATKQLINLMPSVRGFTSVNNQLASGSSWIQHIWSGQVWQVILQVKHPELFRYETPAGETPLNSDTVAIPANAPHPGTALLFLDWVLKPENVHENVKYIGYPQATNQGIVAYNEIVKQYPFLKMNTEDIASGKHFLPLAPQQLASWSADWLQLKAA